MSICLGTSAVAKEIMTAGPRWAIKDGTPIAYHRISGSINVLIQ